MARRFRTWVIAAGAALVLATAIAPQHRANIEILTHNAGDVAPRRVQAVVDLGIVAISVLVTWSRQLR